MRIAQISDTHLIVEGPGSERRIADFERVMADINRLDPAPDVIVHTGDITHNGTPNEYTAAAEILRDASVPVYVLAGNKDDRAELRAAFSDQAYLREDTDFITYAVEDFPVRLLMLDTVNPASKKGDFCVARFELLDQLANVDCSKPLAVFMHHPPFEVLVGPERHHFGDPAASIRLASRLRDLNEISAVFCGHVHRPTTGLIGTVPAVVMPSVATELRYGDYPPKMLNTPIYFVHQYQTGHGFSTQTRIYSL